MKLVSMSNRTEKLATQEYDKVTEIKEAQKSESFNKNKARVLNNDECNNNVTNAVHYDDDAGDGDCVDDHCASSVRLLRIRRAAPGLETYGFHLTRTKWDPYPWINAIDMGTPAAQCGLKAGDCLLEVNGHNVIGMRITEIAKLVKASTEAVTLRLWTSNCLAKCNTESICCAPMPQTLQRLSVIVQSILSIIECPVCLETITPPAMQCQNGHLLCVNCRIRAAEKCPVCRDYYTPRRALIAEKIYATITNAFDLCHNEDKLRQRLFGRTRMQLQQQYQPLLRSSVFCRAPMSDGNGGRIEEFHGSIKSRQNQRKIARLPTNKFLTKLLYKKAYSMENITESTRAATANACKLLAANSMKEEEQTANTDHNRNENDGDAFDKRLCCEQVFNNNKKNCEDTMQSCSNQFHWRTNDRNHLTSIVEQQQQQQQQGQDEHQMQQQKQHQKQQQCTQSMTATRLTTSEAADRRTWPKIPRTATAAAATTMTMTMIPTNNVAQSNGISKHYSLSTNDLYVAPDVTITQPSLTPKPNPSTMKTTSTTIATTSMTTTLTTLADKKILAGVEASGTPTVATVARVAATANVTNSIDNNKNRMPAFLLLDKRNSSIESLSSSIECIRRSSLLQMQHEDTFDDDADDEDKKAIKTMRTPSAADLEIIKQISMADAKMLNKIKANDLQQFSMTENTIETIEENVTKTLPSPRKLTLSHSPSTRFILEDTSLPSLDTVECMSSTL